MPLSLMNRLNKTESAIFKFWMLCFQMISFRLLRDTLSGRASSIIIIIFSFRRCKLWQYKEE